MWLLAWSCEAIMQADDAQSQLPSLASPYSTCCNVTPSCAAGTRGVSAPCGCCATELCVSPEGIPLFSLGCKGSGPQPFTNHKLTTCCVTLF